LSRPEFLSLVRYRVNQMLDAGFNRYLVQVFRDLSTEPPVDAIGGGVDLFIMLCRQTLQTWVIVGSCSIRQ